MHYLCVPWGEAHAQSCQRPAAKQHSALPHEAQAPQSR